MPYLEGPPPVSLWLPNIHVRQLLFHSFIADQGQVKGRAVIPKGRNFVRKELKAAP